jgi:chaperonin GroES
MLQPIRDGIICEAPEKKEDEKIAGGLLYKPGNIDSAEIEATIVAIGSGRITNNGILPLEVAVGDRILFRRHAASEVKFDNKNYLVLREDQVICKV